jgi:hypothetical protein
VFFLCVLFHLQSPFLFPFPISLTSNKESPKQLDSQGEKARAGERGIERERWRNLADLVSL